MDDTTLCMLASCLESTRPLARGRACGIQSSQRPPFLASFSQTLTKSCSSPVCKESQWLCMLGKARQQLAGPAKFTHGVHQSLEQYCKPTRHGRIGKTSPCPSPKQDGAVTPPVRYPQFVCEDAPETQGGRCTYMLKARWWRSPCFPSSHSGQRCRIGDPWIYSKAQFKIQTLQDHTQSSQSFATLTCP